MISSKPILEPVNLCTCLYYGHGLTQTRVAPVGRTCPAHPPASAR